MPFCLPLAAGYTKQQGACVDNQTDLIAYPGLDLEECKAYCDAWRGYSTTSMCEAFEFGRVAGGLKFCVLKSGTNTTDCNGVAHISEFWVKGTSPSPQGPPSLPLCLPSPCPIPWPSLRSGWGSASRHPILLSCRVVSVWCCSTHT